MFTMWHEQLPSICDQICLMSVNCQTLGICYISFPSKGIAHRGLFTREAAQKRSCLFLPTTLPRFFPHAFRQSPWRSKDRDPSLFRMRIGHWEDDKMAQK